MLGLDVGDHGDHRSQAQEGAVALVGLRHQEVMEEHKFGCQVAGVPRGVDERCVETFDEDELMAMNHKLYDPRGVSDREAQDIIRDPHGIGEVGVALDKLQQPVVGDGDQGVDMFGEVGDALLGDLAAPRPLEGERFGHDRHRQSTQIFANFSNDRGRTGTGASAESGRDKYHVTVRQSVSDFFFIFKGRIPADLGICPGPEAFGHTFAQLDPNRRLGYFKGLGVCIGRNKLDTLEIGCDHVVYGVSSRTPDTNDFDFCRIFIFNIGKHFLPSYRFELMITISTVLYLSLFQPLVVTG